MRILPRFQWSLTPPPVVAGVIPGTQVFSFCCPPAAQASAEFCRSDAGAAVEVKKCTGASRERGDIFLCRVCYRCKYVAFCTLSKCDPSLLTSAYTDWRFGPRPSSELGYFFFFPLFPPNSGLWGPYTPPSPLPFPTSLTLWWWKFNDFLSSFLTFII